MTVTEAAAALGYSRKHIYALIERGHLQPVRDQYKLRGGYLIPSSQVERIKQTRLQTPSQE